MNGAEWLARALAGTGMTHVFFVESGLRRTLLQLEDLGVTPILAHSEKAAAYMADGYARVAGRPGARMAQAVGAAHLTSGLRGPLLGRGAAALTAARRVAIVAGDGAAASQAGPEILTLAEALAAPVATTLGARGVIPTRHRLSAGVAGSYSAPPGNRIVHGADLVLFIGCDTGDQVTLNWTIPTPTPPLVQTDPHPLDLARTYPNPTRAPSTPHP